MAVGKNLYSLSDINREQMNMNTPKVAHHNKNINNQMNVQLTTMTTLRHKKSKSNLRKSRPAFLREPMNFSLLPPIADVGSSAKGISLASPPPRRRKRKNKNHLVSIEREI